jgi:hypothetical protein
VARVSLSFITSFWPNKVCVCLVRPGFRPGQIWNRSEDAIERADERGRASLPAISPSSGVKPRG